MFSNPRTATWVRCSGRHVLAPVLTKIHAREASRHVHAGALISLFRPAGPKGNQLRGEHKVTQLVPFFERFASAMIICEPSSNQHPPPSCSRAVERNLCGSRKAVRPSSRRRRRQLDKAPDFLRPWGGRLYNLVSAEELRSLFLQKV